MALHNLEMRLVGVTANIDPIVVPVSSVGFSRMVKAGARVLVGSIVAGSARPPPPRPSTVTTIAITDRRCHRRRRAMHATYIYIYVYIYV